MIPFISTQPVGIYQVCTTANTDYPIAVPDGAIGARLWFETSASNSAVIGGRVGFDKANTAVAGITGTDTVLAYHPSIPVLYETPRTYSTANDTVSKDAIYIHVACPTALAVVRGMWLYRSDS